MKRAHPTRRLSRRLTAATMLGLCCGGAIAAGPSRIIPLAADQPLYPHSVTSRSDTDWLLDGTSFEAATYRTLNEREILLSNGLITRIFRFHPNGATVGFDNLMTGEALLRGVKPEALLTIDGTTYEIGGLRGQPNYAYLKPEWAASLTTSPHAFEFAGLRIGEIQPRLAWKQVRHHAPNVVWPPRGVTMRFDYRFPDLTATDLELFMLGQQPDRQTGLRDNEVAPLAPPSTAGRDLLYEDDFRALDPGWRVHASTAHERCSFENEGKLGEIYTPSNTAVYAERDLPLGTRLVQATIDVGTDRSASWGPGIALVFDDCVIKFNIRPGGGGYDGAPRFGAFDGQTEQDRVGGQIKLDISEPWTLRLRLVGATVLCEAKPKSGDWHTYHALELDPELATPRAVRIGKLDLRGGGDDFGEVGELVRLRVLDFAAYSDLNEDAQAKLRERFDTLRPLRVSVHYALYDGLPLISKWLTVHNAADEPITIDRFTSELLAAVEPGSFVGGDTRQMPTPNLHIETDYSFGGGMAAAGANDHVTRWVPDPDYATQVNYQRLTPCLLEVGPTIGPAQTVAPGETFESFRTWELVYDSTDRERNGLALRRMYRTIAPWVTENPLMMHVRYADWETVKAAIDQCVEVGFEMVILTFGSGFNIENDSEAYLAEMKRYADYARSKGVEIGGYSLLASRRVGGGHDVVLPEGQRPTFGNSPCLHSDWGQNYFRKLYEFYPATGFALLEHDGSYPGDPCMATHHPGHDGYDDSRWNQWRLISGFYQWCRANGVYLNVPDWYYLAGSNKCGMGYRETNWSLPRAQQVIHTRQNIYDGTWTKTPSMGWMFVPLTQYHGGGAAATIEPLREHLDHYGRMLSSNLALGAQACYRGPPPL